MKRLPSSPTSWLLGLAAMLLASFLLVFYVNLLRDAVTRGSQFKYAQQEPRTVAPKTAQDDPP
jgi:hypothetical protein